MCLDTQLDQPVEVGFLSSLSESFTNDLQTQVSDEVSFSLLVEDIFCYKFYAH